VTRSYVVIGDGRLVPVASGVGIRRPRPALLPFLQVAQPFAFPLADGCWAWVSGGRWQRRARQYGRPLRDLYRGSLGRGR
jgi:hypothetical protein